MLHAGMKYRSSGCVSLTCIVAGSAPRAKSGSVRWPRLRRRAAFVEVLEGAFAIARKPLAGVINGRDLWA